MSANHQFIWASIFHLSDIFQVSYIKNIFVWDLILKVCDIYHKI